MCPWKIIIYFLQPDGLWMEIKRWKKSNKTNKKVVFSRELNVNTHGFTKVE